MYKSLHIKNFRGFRDFEIGPLARINLIGGKNNVGKTALLEAIFLLSGPAKPQFRHSLALGRGFERLAGESITRLWQDVFHDFDTDQLVEISAATNNEKLHLMIRIAVANDSGPIDIPLNTIDAAMTVEQRNELLDYIYTRDGQTYKKNFRLENGSLILVEENGSAPPLPSVAFVFSRGGQSLDALAVRFSNAVTRKLKDDILQALQIVEPRLTAIELVAEGDQKIIYGDIGGSRLIPLQLMGEGLTRLLTLLVNIAHVAPDGIVLFDEIENGFHFSVMENVWRAIGDFVQKQNVQIFATTHSAEAIDAAQATFQDDDEELFRWHRLGRREVDRIEAVTYDKEAFDAAVDFNIEVR